MKKIILCCISFFLSACLFESSDELTGTVDEVDTKINAMIYSEKGKPVPSAKVMAFKINETEIALETETDSNGAYTLKGLNGTYNIWAEKDDKVSFQDSVFIFPDTQYVESDTLRKPGSITAKVGLQPGDDYQTVTVNVLGTHIYSNVDSEGWFTLDGMPQGTYQIRLETDLPNYTTTYSSLKVETNQEDTLSDTLWLIYAGIPLVTTLETSYDTLNGVMTLNWDSVDYFNFQEYLLYRQEDSAKEVTTVPIGIVKDTFFVDTIYSGNRSLGEHFLDSSSYSFQYRIKIRNKFDEEGKVYGYTEANAYPPYLVKTFMDFRLGKNEMDTMSRNDTVSITVEYENQTRVLQKIKWMDGDSVIKTADLDDDKKSGSQTLKYTWPEEGEKKIYAIVEDDAGTLWKDSIAFHVVEDAPEANAGNDTLVLSNSDLKLQGTAKDRFGSIKKWEWKFGGMDKFVQTKTGDTTIVAPGSEQDDYRCILKVTDDDGKTDLDTLVVSTKKAFVVAPEENASISGVYKVSGTADKTVDKVEVRIGNDEWVTASGVSEWSADVETRLIFPAKTLDVEIRGIKDAEENFKVSIPVRVTNPDPIIGCWSREGSSTTQCFSRGSCDSWMVSGWASGWSRRGDNQIIIYVSNGSDRVFDVEFYSFNHVKFTYIVDGREWEYTKRQ